MSTKIYYAFRCSIRDFTEVFLPKYREHCFRTVKKQIGKLTPHVEEAKIKEIYDSKGWAEKMDYDAFRAEKEEMIRVREVLKRAAKASKDPVRDVVFGIDCSLNVWLHRGKAYIIPYGERWIYDDFKLPKGVEEYGYWNNTDEPDNVTRRQWQARGKTWEAVCLNNWNATRLTHEIIKASGHTVGLEELARRLLPEKHRFAVTIGLEDK